MRLRVHNIYEYRHHYTIACLSQIQYLHSCRIPRTWILPLAAGGTTHADYTNVLMENVAYSCDFSFVSRPTVRLLLASVTVAHRSSYVTWLVHIILQIVRGNRRQVPYAGTILMHLYELQITASNKLLRKNLHSLHVNRMTSLMAVELSYRLCSRQVPTFIRR